MNACRKPLNCNSVKFGDNIKKIKQKLGKKLSLYKFNGRIESGSYYLKNYAITFFFNGGKNAVYEIGISRNE